MIRRVLQKQTLASFDYQWRELTEGGALLTDDWFTRNVDRIISEELLCLDPAWFRGKRGLPFRRHRQRPMDLSRAPG